MNERVYDIDQANRALPLVRAIVEDLLRLQEEQTAALRDYEALRMSREPEQARLNRLHRALREVEADQAACLRELDELGILVEDVAAGRVGFPSELDGEAIVLDWRPGDDAVDHYRAPGEPSSARKPLPVAVS